MNKIYEAHNEEKEKKIGIDVGCDKAEKKCKNQLNALIVDWSEKTSDIIDKIQDVWDSSDIAGSKCRK